MVDHADGRNRSRRVRAGKQRSAYSTWWRSRWPWLRHKLGTMLAVTALLLGASTFLGCRQVLDLDAAEWKVVCETALWCSAPEPPAELVDIVWHSFPGSPATPDIAKIVIGQVLSRVVDRPGSITRWWVVANDTALLTELKSPTLTGRPHRAKKAERSRWLQDTEAALLNALTPRLTAPPPASQSLVGAIASVALAAEGHPLRGHHQLVVIADGREALMQGAGCDLLMADDARLKQLPWRRLLTPQILHGTRAHLVGFNNPPHLPGSPASYAVRAALGQSLWGDIFWSAGASEVFIEGGGKGVHFMDQPFPFQEGNPFWLMPAVLSDQK